MGDDVSGFCDITTLLNQVKTDLEIKTSQSRANLWLLSFRLASVAWNVFIVWVGTEDEAHLKCSKSNDNNLTY
jgi:hypothetical protein